MFHSNSGASKTSHFQNFQEGNTRIPGFSGRRVHCHLEHWPPNPIRQPMISLLEPSMMSSSTTSGLILPSSFRGLHTASSSSSDLHSTTMLISFNMTLLANPGRKTSGNAALVSGILIHSTLPSATARRCNQPSIPCVGVKRLHPRLYHGNGMGPPSCRELCTIQAPWAPAPGL